jgi:hypothetical protein
MHRALAAFVLEPLDIVLSVLLVILFSILWLACVPFVCRVWQHIFETGSKLLALNLPVGLSEQDFPPFLHFVIPFPRVEDVAPDFQTWWLTTAVVLALFGASFLVPKKLLPVTYLLRGILLVQTSALIYFALAPDRFPHTPVSYMAGLARYGIALISFVPIVFGLTYYIFDFGLLRKSALTALTMTHLSLFLPLQMILQAVVLQKTVLFMPALYIVFGMPVDVLVIVAFYSWGMSWSAKVR